MEKYRDIIRMPRHISPLRPKMPASGRAAQFAPFASLRGFERRICDAQSRNEDAHRPLTGDVWVC